MMKRRIGKFKVTRDALMANDEACHKIFSRITPLAIEWDYNGIATITGLSDLFEELEEYIKPLDYEITLKLDGDKLSVKATRT